MAQPVTPNAALANSRSPGPNCEKDNVVANGSFMESQFGPGMAGMKRKAEI
jgi:hypothetical protein